MNIFYIFKLDDCGVHVFFTKNKNGFLAKFLNSSEKILGKTSFMPFFHILAEKTINL